MGEATFTNDNTDLNYLPHFDQYMGVWAMPEREFLKRVNFVRSLDIAKHLAEARMRLPIQKEAEAKYENIDGVALIELQGTMTKYSSSFGLAQGTILTRQAIRTARRDPKTSAILLRIDSPGGSVSGTGDLADEVARAAAQKPVYAFIEDIGASAAYWVASQATKVFANPTAEVGSIGVYGVIEDYSAMYAKEGIRSIVIKAGRYKGAGVDGAPVTDDQISDYQRVINDFHRAFTASVSNGRRLNPDRMEQVATGQVWLAPEAKKLGLIDGITDFESILNSMTAEFKPKQRNSNKGGGRMAEQTEVAETVVAEEPCETGEQERPEPQAATIQELKTALPKASAEFIVAQLEAGATLDQAKDAYIADLQEQTDRALAEVEETLARIDKPGVETLGGGTGNTDAGGGAIEQWESLVAECAKKCRTKAEAIRMANKKDPDLRQAYLDEYNAAHSG